MALININGVGVLSGTIIMPLIGVWTADLVIDQPDGSGFSAGTQVTIASDNGFELTGVVAPDRSGDFLDSVHVRVLGGAGGMAKLATPRSFAQPGAFSRDVVNGLLSDSGETLAISTDAAFLGRNLVAWTVMTMPVSQALQKLIEIVSPDVSWRILPDGTLWIGSETWPAASPSFELIEQTPAEGTAELGVASPEIVPGTDLAGVGHINRVEHQIDSNMIRSRVWLDLGEGDRGIAAAVQSLAKQAIPGIDYLALYEATVVSQSADMTTLDLIPKDSRLPNMGRVPIRHGLPGFKCQVVPGCTILIGWDGGDPSKPYVALWGGGETLIQLLLGGDLALEPVIKGNLFSTAIGALNNAGLSVVGAQLTAAAADPIMIALLPVADAALNAAGAALTAASIAFASAMPGTLSTIVKTI